jgi:hypothetical protein
MVHMRFIIIHRTNAHWEAGAIPEPSLIRRVEVLMGEIASAGALLAGEGLGPSSEGVRLRFEGGARTTIAGPLTGEHELEDRFSIVRVASLDAAIDWATRQAAILGDGEFDIRPVHEAWDIGIGSPPEGDTTRRWMVLRKATATTEGGGAFSADSSARLSKLVEESTTSGVHLVSETMKPSRKGRRYTNSRDGKTFYDGPFAETRELLGGYVVVEASSLDDACRWAPKYMDAVGVDAVDVRELQ